MHVFIKYMDGSQTKHEVSAETWNQMQEDYGVIKTFKTYPQLPSGKFQVDWNTVTEIGEVPPFQTFTPAKPEPFNWG